MKVTFFSAIMKLITNLLLLLFVKQRGRVLSTSEEATEDVLEFHIAEEDSNGMIY